MGNSMSIIEDNGYFVFDGIKSSDYGVWINGRETFNAPARRYNEYVIPGRNGTLTIDDGSFEDQEVTYPAFIVEDFGANIEAFRNQLMSRTGYVRMTDSYHPDEYYLAKYMSGLEAKVLPKGAAGSFDLTFKRDPRRFLLSGDTSVTYPPGNVNGKNRLIYPYYNTTKDSYGIHFDDVGDGTVLANGQRTSTSNLPIFQTAGNSTIQMLEDGETYIVSGCPEGGGADTYEIRLVQTSSPYPVFHDYGNGVSFTFSSSKLYYMAIYISKTEQITDLLFKPMIRKASDTDPTWTPYINPSSIVNPTLFESNPLIRVTGSGTVTIGDEVITVGSGYSYVDIDSEIQNCYCGLQNANSVVSFGSGKFPTLKPGITGISYSSGITSVQITPRWYRL